MGINSIAPTTDGGSRPTRTGKKDKPDGGGKKDVEKAIEKKYDTDAGKGEGNIERTGPGRKERVEGKSGGEDAKEGAKVGPHGKKVPGSMEDMPDHTNCWPFPDPDDPRPDRPIPDLDLPDFDRPDWPDRPNTEKPGGNRPPAGGPSAPPPSPPSTPPAGGPGTMPAPSPPSTPPNGGPRPPMDTQIKELLEQLEASGIPTGPTVIAQTAPPPPGVVPINVVVPGNVEHLQAQLQAGLEALAAMGVALPGAPANMPPQSAS